jgi:hypothetical protein
MLPARLVGGATVGDLTGMLTVPPTAVLGAAVPPGALADVVGGGWTDAPAGDAAAVRRRGIVGVRPGPAAAAVGVARRHLGELTAGVPAGRVVVGRLGAGVATTRLAAAGRVVHRRAEPLGGRGGMTHGRRGRMTNRRRGMSHGWRRSRRAAGRRRTSGRRSGIPGGR